jgi:alpha-mannosidase
MAPFDECSVLIPSATLEDFPTGLSAEEARSLLAGWTVLWHPRLLAQTEQLPTWYRADSPPTPDGPRVILVPDPSFDQLPTDFRRKCDANDQCLWITGGDRNEMLSGLQIDSQAPELAPLEHAGRTLSVDDFYAAGFTALQIQVMTRRLRYTSNLDELYLQSRMVEAAKAFLARDGRQTADALHDVFDCLAEERDHYFSSDPHLIDLALLTPETLHRAIEAGWLDELANNDAEGDENNGRLGTPKNVLLTPEIANLLSATPPANRTAPEHTPLKSFVDLIANEKLGWAGGGHASHPDQPCLDALTIAAATKVFQAGAKAAEDAVGRRPKVYGRLSGITPADLAPTLLQLGYRGVIPIDFAAGTGFADESKMMLPAGDDQLEALTARPIDANNDAEFLSFGARLGEAIDTGEVATGLLVHWPQRTCDSFHDLQRAATWGVALGRFWSLERYFTEGERPYHNAVLESISKHAAAVVVERLVDDQNPTTLHAMADAFCEIVRQETRSTTRAIATLANPAVLDSTADDQTTAKDNESFVAEALGYEVASTNSGSTNSDAGTKVCFNPHSVGMRRQTRLTGGAPPAESFIYARSAAGNGGCDVTFDIPATGMTTLTASESVPRPKLLKRLIGGVKPIAENGVLRNEFMAVSLSESGGGISGIYSASRGNRLSMRLATVEGDRKGEAIGEMICDGLRIKENTPAVGSIEATGTLQSPAGKQIASFEILYRLERGSRLLDIRGTLTPDWDSIPEPAAANFWQHYIAIRTAVASEASIIRALVRDKIHQAGPRRFVAPLGVLIDEAEKQTAIASHGFPLHRRVGDRFVDTLIQPLVRGCERATTIPFCLTYAIDAPNPVAMSRSRIAPPMSFPVKATGQQASTKQAWLMHVSSADVIVTEMTTSRRSDGKLAAALKLVQTRPKNSKLRLQFCSFATAAFIANANGINRTLDELPDDVCCEDGAVSLTIGSHQTLDLVVVFDV